MLLLKLPSLHACKIEKSRAYFFFLVENLSRKDSIFNAFKEDSQTGHIKLPVNHSEKVDLVQHSCSVRKNICVTDSVAVICSSSKNKGKPSLPDLVLKARPLFLPSS